MRRSDKQLIKDGEFAEELVNDDEFAEFILHAAEHMLTNCTLEELAVLGFGTLEDALEAYQEQLEAE